MLEGQKPASWLCWLQPVFICHSSVNAGHFCSFRRKTATNVPQAKKTANSKQTGLQRALRYKEIVINFIIIKDVSGWIPMCSIATKHYGLIAAHDHRDNSSTEGLCWKSHPLLNVSFQPHYRLHKENTRMSVCPIFMLRETMWGPDE